MNPHCALILSPMSAVHQPSYALALLTAGLKSRRIAVTCFDYNLTLHKAVSEEDRTLWLDANSFFWAKSDDVTGLWHRYEGTVGRWIDDLAALAPSLIGISVSASAKWFAQNLVRAIKQRVPSCTLVLGGPDCFRPETGIEYLQWPEVDAMCVGEGDLCFPEFASQLFATGRMPRIPGILYKGDDGQIVDTGDAEVITDLDALPFADYTPFDFSDYPTGFRVSLSMSRGCVNRCVYCSESRNFKKYRHRSAQSVFDEIRHQIRHMPSERVYVHFCDSIVNGNVKVLEEFCDLVLTRRDVASRIEWGGLMCLRSEMTRDLLQKMYDAGCRQISWGLESGSDKVLKLMRKRYDAALAKRIIKDAHGIGFYQAGNIIVGFPGEDEMSFYETLEFVGEMRRYLDSVGVPMMEIRPNSPICEQYEEFGVVDPLRWDWRTKDGSNNYALRLARMKLVHGVLGDRLFSQGRYEEDLYGRSAPEASPESHATGTDELVELLAAETIELMKPIARRNRSLVHRAKRRIVAKLRGQV